MSHSKPKPTHKAVHSDVSIGRLRSRLSEEPVRPASDLESTFTSSLTTHKPTRLRLARPKVPEHQACLRGQQLPRSLSATKTSKAEEKQPTPAKERLTSALKSVHSEAFFKLRLPSQDISRRKSNKDSLNATTIAREDFSQSFATDSVSPRTQTGENVVPFKTIEGKLLREIRTSGKESDFASEIELYSHLFREIIEQNPACRSLLVDIKAKYEGWLRVLTDREHRNSAKYQSDIIRLQNALLQAMEENTALARKVEQLTADRAEWAKTRENYERKCSQYQGKLREVANTRLEDFPPTEEAWQVLTSELTAYKSWKKKVLQELKASQSREKRLNELVQALQKRGFPIDEAFVRDMKPKKQTTSTRSEDSSDSELLSAPIRQLIKPEPVLQLRLEDTEAHPSPGPESNRPSRPKPIGKEANSAKGSGKVPSLTFPSNASEGFHQEFMAKYDEFSESWRQLIDAEKH